ncbi:LOW QUALITY PROTEIN: synaptonemal complex central element protein 1-like [Hippopotamus amphibius kiboko]|uniref:LOW QUALITY PROTEIN: synaptonemal complex central element protein 1-like n=1 Tax=Hippopotamus amphibius kiboko TaxID=575201 RepID=UPI0025927C75|nr:LOW QUALITY PROTEIN: synaptonemal complex central element protein 1-like [Hippopotamus amphibius kiboko]
MRTAQAFRPHVIFFKPIIVQSAHASVALWKMAGKLEPSEVGPPEIPEKAEGQTKFSKKTEDLLEMVKKLQKEGSLEPQIEDLINRINELQQAKKTSSEELGEAQALWEALRRDLDSLNGEKAHLEEVLSKKQEALRTLQLHCQRKESEAQRKYMLAEHMEQISIHNSQITESQGQRKLGLHMEEQLEDLTSQHKDLWEFHVLKQRLAWEIRVLQSSKEQLLAEERQARAKLQELEQRLRSPPEVQGAPAEDHGLKAEPEKLGGQVPAQTQSTPEDPARRGEVESPGWRPRGPRRRGRAVPGASLRGECAGAGRPRGAGDRERASADGLQGLAA